MIQFQNVTSTKNSVQDFQKDILGYHVFIQGTFSWFYWMEK